MTTSNRRGNARDEEGITLVEQIVVMAVTLIVLGGLALVFINMWRAQSNVDSTTFSTARGQQIGEQIERAVRNAEAVRVDDGGNTLRVHTRLPGAAACQAWSVSGSDLRVASGMGPLGSPTTWAAWTSNLAPLPSGAHFTGDADGLEYAFRFQTSGAPVDISGESYARTASDVSAPCW
jgi:hypothetical protein